MDKKTPKCSPDGRRDAAGENPGVLFVMVTTLFVIAVVIGCERVDIGSGRPSPVEEAEKPEEMLLFSGVKYPEGYDWNRDSEYGSVECSLFLASADEWILSERKVGTKFCVAPDSDMHRILGGSLWEDWSTDIETIVTRDGAEQFRWAWRECISEALLSVLVDPFLLQGFMLEDMEDHDVETVCSTDLPQANHKP